MRLPGFPAIRRLAKRAIIPEGLALCGAACALLLAEGAVRLFFDEGSRPRVVVDSGFGVRANRSNASVQLSAPDEYRVSVTTNSHGMRGGDREYALRNRRDRRGSRFSVTRSSMALASVTRTP